MLNTESFPEPLNLVSRECGCVAERLANVFAFEISKLADDLRCGHAIGDELDNVGNRDAKAADRR